MNADAHKQEDDTLTANDVSCTAFFNSTGACKCFINWGVRENGQSGAKTFA
jgi:hypothetical protein